MNIKMTKNTPESRRELEYNKPYLVRYYDENSEESLAVGVPIMGNHFKYPYMGKRPAPPMSAVISWFSPKDWKPETGDMYDLSEILTLAAG